MEISRKFECDVLIIGGGGAALRSAYEAAKARASVILLEKGTIGSSGATVSQNSQSLAWQMADECSVDDSPDEHEKNIVEIGLSMADPHIARILSHELIGVSRELEQLGMHFIADPLGKHPHYSGYSCFANKSRAHGLLNEGYGHGGAVVQCLLKHIDSTYVQFHNGIFVSDLLVEDGMCFGCLALSSDGQWLLYKAGAVILATGGAWQIFPPEPGKDLIHTSGDGYAMGYRCGAELANMEFMQYMLHRAKPFGIEVPGVYWALEPRLLDRNGKAVLDRYIPSGTSVSTVMRQRTEHYPFSTRDNSKWLDIAIASELAAGNGNFDGTMWLDFKGCDVRGFTPSRPQHIPEDFSKPAVITGNGMEKIRIAAHAINGGLTTGEWAQTTISGLYAIGEVATGAHGADRLGGGMVSSGQVFGKRAAQEAVLHARHAKKLQKVDIHHAAQRISSFGCFSDELEAEVLLGRFQFLMSTNFSLIRSDRSMRFLLGELETIRNEDLVRLRFKESSEKKKAMELANLIDTAVLMVQAALFRKESRGGHYRSDYPMMDDTHWNFRVVLKNEDEKLRIIQRSMN